MIIGLSGYAQTGKDETAKILVREHGFKRLAFADPIRDAVYGLNPLVEGGQRVADLVDEYGWDVAKGKDEVRRLLQAMGAEVGRKQFGSDFWVVVAMSQIGTSTDVVFTDVRFPNEAKAIADMNGAIVRVIRPNTSAVNDHESEVAMDRYDFDATIINNGTVEDLNSQVNRILKLFKQ
jgi:dephospho-CoA kinase